MQSMVTLKELEAMETRYRANFVNSLGGFKSVVLIGTRSLDGNENLAVFNSLFHLGANPALCGIVVRPNEETQNTLGNIIRTGQYTINHILPAFYKQAHQCSAKYEAGVSEFKAVGLTPEYVDGIFAPFVQESRIKFACQLEQKLALEINGTTILIGKINNVVVPDAFISEDGFINLEQAETITCSGLDSYHTTRQLARLSYAKVGQDLVER